MTNPPDLNTIKELIGAAAAHADKIRPGELVAVAVALAGPSASDAEIAQQFPRAFVLTEQAEAWLGDVKNRDAATDHYVLENCEEADAADPKLPWNDETLLKLAGYGPDSGRGKDATERGKKLWDAVRKGAENKWPPSLAEQLKNDFRQGIELSRFKRIWPSLSTWRARNLENSSSAK